MKGLKIGVAQLACCVFLLAGANAVQAATLAGYPAPGGTTFVGSGNAGAAGGNTRVYSGFDDAYYDQLWWGPTNPSLGNNCCFALSPLTTIGSFGSSVETWTGSATVSFNNGFSYSQTVNARFTSTLSGGAVWQDPSTVGIGGGPLAVVEVTSPTGFTVNSIFEVKPGSGWVPFLTWYDQQDGNVYGSRTSFGGEFWYTVAPQSGGDLATPLPAALPLFATGLAGLGWLARRKRKTTAA